MWAMTAQHFLRSRQHDSDNQQTGRNSSNRVYGRAVRSDLTARTPLTSCLSPLWTLRVTDGSDIASASSAARKLYAKALRKRTFSAGVPVALPPEEKLRVPRSYLAPTSYQRVASIDRAAIAAEAREVCCHASGPDKVGGGAFSDTAEADVGPSEQGEGAAVEAAAEESEHGGIAAHRTSCVSAANRARDRESCSSD